MGMIHNKFHLISPGCPQPSIALQQNHGLKHQSSGTHWSQECSKRVLLYTLIAQDHSHGVQIAFSALQFALRHYQDYGVKDMSGTVTDILSTGEKCQWPALHR